MKNWITVFCLVMTSASFAIPLNPAKDHVYRTDGMEGRTLNDLFVDYTGIRGKVPHEARVDFEKNLHAMWQRKTKRARGNPVVNSLAKDVIRRYRAGQPGRMTLKDYARHVNAVVSQARNDLDWERVAAIEGLDKRRLHLVRAIASRFHGSDFIAYELTELMPGYDGPLNKAVLNFLIRNAGRNYVESIPAMFDPYCSFGPYQFTQYAWYKGPDGIRGGSRVNEASRHPITHGSVAQLRGDEHYIAAFDFAIDNLSYTIRRLNRQELGTLEKVAGTRHTELVEFVAAAHHAPYGTHGAQGAMKRWLAHKATKRFRQSCSPTLTVYVRKTSANLQALGGH